MEHGTGSGSTPLSNTFTSRELRMPFVSPSSSNNYKTSNIANTAGLLQTAPPIINTFDQARTHVASLNLRYREQIAEAMGQLSEAAYAPNSNVLDSTYLNLSNAFMEAYHRAPKTPGLPYSILDDTAILDINEMLAEAALVTGTGPRLRGDTDITIHDVLHQVGLNFHTARQNNLGVPAEHYFDVLTNTLRGDGYQALVQLSNSEKLLSMIPKDAFMQRNLKSRDTPIFRDVLTMAQIMVDQDNYRLSDPDSPRLDPRSHERSTTNVPTISTGIANQVFTAIKNGTPIAHIVEQYNIPDISTYWQLNKELVDAGSSRVPHRHWKPQDA